MHFRNAFFKQSTACLLIALICMTVFTSAVSAEDAEHRVVQENSIYKAIDWLRQNQNDIGSWGLDDSAFVDTSEVCGYLSENALLMDNMQKSVDWMESLEITNNDIGARILPFIKGTDKGDYITSTIIESQNKDGGWGIANGYESDILDTIMVLEALVNLSDIDVSVLKNAVNYIIGVQNKNGCWSYLDGDDGEISLTAQVVIALSNFQKKINLTSDQLQTSMRKAGEYLVSVQKTDKTWGTDEASIKDTLLAFQAVLNTLGADFADSVDASIIGVQDNNGSWYGSPYLTALAIKAITYYKDMPYAKINEITLLKDENGSKIECYNYNAYEAFEIQVDATYANIDAELLYFVKLSDASFISLQIEEQAAWNTKNCVPGNYSIIVQVKDKSTGLIVSGSEKQFTIAPSFKVSTVIVTTDKKNTRIDTPVTVNSEVTVVTESNIDRTLDLKLTVTNEDIVVASESNTVECTSVNQVKLIKGISFEPDVTSVKEYTFEVQVAEDSNIVFEADTLFKVLPPIPPTRIDISQNLDKLVLYPGDDSVSASFKLLGEGTPEGPQRVPIDLVLILDSSGSMSGTPWTKTKEAAKNVADMIQDEDRCAVVRFASSASTQVSLINDKEFVKKSITDMSFSGGGTAMDAGIQQALGEVKDVSTEREVVFMLLSDGVPNSQSAVYTKVSTAIQKGIKIFTLGLGGVNGAFMQDIATKTGGTYKYSPTAQDLNTIMTDLAGEIFDTAGKNVIFETTIPSNQMTVDTAQILPVPSAVINNEDGSKTLKWTMDKLVMGEEKVFEITYNGANLVSDTNVLLTKNTKLTYNDRNGTEVIENIQDLQIPVSKYLIDSEVLTNKQTYKANENMEITNITKNMTSYSSTLTGEVIISDSDGNRVAVAESDISNTWLANESKELSFIWNTSNTMAGKYKVQVVWREEEKIISFSECNFEIVIDEDITGTITTEKMSYSANESVNITETIKNNSINSIIDEMIVSTYVCDSSGTTLWSKNTVTSEILPLGKAVLKNTWNTGKNKPGTYTVTMAVYQEEAGFVLDSAIFEIVSGTEGIQGISGSIEIPKNIINSKEAVDFSYKITNTGNMELTEVISRIRIIDTLSMETIGTMTKNNDLSVAQSVYVDETWIHEPIGKGVYMIVLDAVLSNGEEVTLDSGYIMVEKPAVLDSEALKYTLFSASDIYMYTSRTTVNGDVHSNNIIQSAGSVLTINGICSSGEVPNMWVQSINIVESLTGAEPIEMPNAVNEIKEIAAIDAEVSDNLQITDYGTGIELDNSVISSNAVQINGTNLTSSGYIVSRNNISFNVGNLRSANDTGIVICSSDGDININTSKAEIKGTLYAPNGTVYINVSDFKLTGRIIAKKIVVNCSTFDVASTEQDIDLLDPTINH